MLKRKFRLPWGIKFNNNGLISAQLLTIKNKENGLLLNRFTTIVSKKIDKRAVVRNRIKRLINSCIEELYNHIHKGRDMVFIAKKEAIGKTRQEFYQELKRSLRL